MRRVLSYFQIILLLSFVFLHPTYGAENLENLLQSKPLDTQKINTLIAAELKSGDRTKTREALNLLAKYQSSYKYPWFETDVVNLLRQPSLESYVRELIAAFNSGYGFSQSISNAVVDTLSSKQFVLSEENINLLLIQIINQGPTSHFWKKLKDISQNIRSLEISSARWPGSMTLSADALESISENSYYEIVRQLLPILPSSYCERLIRIAPEAYIGSMLKKSEIPQSFWDCTADFFIKADFSKIDALHVEKILLALRDYEKVPTSFIERIYEVLANLEGSARNYAAREYANELSAKRFKELTLPEIIEKRETYFAKSANVAPFLLVAEKFPDLPQEFWQSVANYVKRAPASITGGFSKSVKLLASRPEVPVTILEQVKEKLTQSIGVGGIHYPGDTRLGVPIRKILRSLETRQAFDPAKVCEMVCSGLLPQFKTWANRNNDELVKNEVDKIPLQTMQLLFLIKAEAFCKKEPVSLLAAKNLLLRDKESKNSCRTLENRGMRQVESTANFWFYVLGRDTNDSDLDSNYSLIFLAQIIQQVKDNKNLLTPAQLATIQSLDANNRLALNSRLKDRMQGRLMDGAGSNISTYAFGALLNVLAIKNDEKADPKVFREPAEALLNQARPTLSNDEMLDYNKLVFKKPESPMERQSKSGATATFFVGLYEHTKNLGIDNTDGALLDRTVRAIHEFSTHANGLALLNKTLLGEYPHNPLEEGSGVHYLTPNAYFIMQEIDVLLSGSSLNDQQKASLEDAKNHIYSVLVQLYDPKTRTFETSKPLSATMRVTNNALGGMALMQSGVDCSSPVSSTKVR